MCLLAFGFLIAFPVHGQMPERKGSDHLFSIALGKSLYSTPDQGASLGDTYVWIPDLEVGIYTNTTRLALDYRYYDVLYPIQYAPGDIEIRKFSLFDLTYNKQRVLNSRKFDVSLGGGLSLRLLNELVIIDVIMTSGGWYEILSERIWTNSLGAIMSADCRYDLTRRLYIEASLSYNAYLNSYNMGRLGLCVGYYLRGQDKR